VTPSQQWTDGSSEGERLLIAITLRINGAGASSYSFRNTPHPPHTQENVLLFILFFLGGGEI